MGHSKINLSYKHFQDGKSAGLFRPPASFSPYIATNHLKYNALRKQYYQKGISYERARDKFKKRVGYSHFKKVDGLQRKALKLAVKSFPAYRFILPEVIADDWLATVDWHKKYHRDHSLHQPLTAYTVLKLLTGGGKYHRSLKIGNKTLLELCVKTILKWEGTAYIKEHLIQMGLPKYLDEKWWINDTENSRQLWGMLFVETAHLAALFHDMGYPWQYINLLGDKLEHVGYLTETPTADSENISEHFKGRLLFQPINGYRMLDHSTPSTWHSVRNKIVEKSLKNTHGFPGAIGFLFLNDVLRDFPSRMLNPLQQFCVEWAAMAIMMHDMGDIYWGKGEIATPPEYPHMRLNFDVDPLSCIVTLADVIQEFERPVVSFDQNGIDTVRMKFSSDCKHTSIEIDKYNDMRITYYYKQFDKFKNKKYFIASKEQKFYFEPLEGYLNFGSCGIDKIILDASM
jgi:hypothetical protein